MTRHGFLLFDWHVKCSFADLLLFIGGRSCFCSKLTEGRWLKQSQISGIVSASQSAYTPVVGTARQDRRSRCRRAQRGARGWSSEEQTLSDGNSSAYAMPGSTPTRCGRKPSSTCAR